MKDKRSNGASASANAAFNDISEWMLLNKYSLNSKYNCWNVWPHSMNTKENRRLNRLMGIIPYTRSNEWNKYLTEKISKNTQTNTTI
jgi:hypothetical protein